MSILCATDFSPCAQEAADVAVALAQKLSLPLRLVHCVHDHIMMGDLPMLVADDQPGKEQLSTEAQRLRESGVVVTEELRYGGPGWDLVEAAREQPTELMVLGSTGKGNAARWLIGSVAEAVAEEAPVPCLVIRRPDILLAWMKGRVELEALCAVSLAGSSDTAISWLGTLASLSPTKIDAAHVHHIQNEAGMLEEPPSPERDVWEKVRGIVGDVPVNVHLRATTGVAAREFLKLAEERNPGLVIVGGRHLHGVARMRSRSFSHRVLAHATTNVFCVPSLPKTSLGVPWIRRVIVATDLGAPAAGIVSHAQSLLPAGGDMHLLHVCLNPSPGLNPAITSEVYFDHSLAMAKARDVAVQEMSQLSSTIGDGSGITVTSEVLSHSSVAEAICMTAGRVGADVICMGSKGHSRVGAALLGSTVQSVLARAHLPVFVIPHPRS
ncbi:MAG TPA: universal stress protein [Prosthecobacter sp.]